MKIDTKYEIGDKVIIDGDRSIRAVVVSVTVYVGGLYTYKLGWWSSGNYSSEDFDEYRLEYAPNV